MTCELTAQHVTSYVASRCFLLVVCANVLKENDIEDVELVEEFRVAKYDLCGSILSYHRFEARLDEIVESLLTRSLHGR